MPRVPSVPSAHLLSSSTFILHPFFPLHPGSQGGGRPEESALGQDQPYSPSQRFKGDPLPLHPLKTTPVLPGPQVRFLTLETVG